VADGTFNTVAVLQVYARSKRVCLADVHAFVTCWAGRRLKFDLFMVFRQNVRWLVALKTGGLLRRNHKSRETQQNDQYQSFHGVTLK
jgi:predicted N-formylglutamate amidohydrolase